MLVYGIVSFLIAKRKSWEPMRLFLIIAAMKAFSRNQSPFLDFLDNRLFLWLPLLCKSGWNSYIYFLFMLLSRTARWSQKCICYLVVNMMEGVIVQVACKSSSFRPQLLWHCDWDRESPRVHSPRFLWHIQTSGRGGGGGDRFLWSPS